MLEKMSLPVSINEDVSLYDLVVKYTIRDTFLGFANLLPGSIGVGTRLLVYRFALRSCGSGLFMKENSVIKFPDRIDIGDNVGINDHCWLSGDGGISIGSHSRLGPKVTIASFEHRIDDRERTIKSQGKEYDPVTIGEDVWIGAGAVVTAGTTIGDGAVIGAGAVVTRDIPEYAIAVGNPAEVIDFRGDDEIGER